MNNLNINLRPEHLEDDLVRIIPLQESDCERLFEVASDPLIWEQHPSKNRYQYEEFKSFFDSAVQCQTAFLIFDKLSDAVIGTSRYYDLKPKESSIAIGYTFLKRSFWGGTYNFSMKKLLIDHAFSFVDSVFFHVGAVNIRSQKAVLKLGSQKVREFEKEDVKQPYFEYELKKLIWKGNLQ